MSRVIKSLSVLAVICLTAGTAAMAQYGNEIELRGVRSRIIVGVDDFIIASTTDQSWQDFRVQSQELHSQEDGSLYTESVLGLTDDFGTTRTLASETVVLPLPDVTEVHADLKIGRSRQNVELVLTARVSDISDVFVGRSNRATFSVLADGVELGQVVLDREDVDGDGLADGVRQMYADAATGAVHEVFIDF